MIERKKRPEGWRLLVETINTIEMRDVQQNLGQPSPQQKRRVEPFPKHPGYTRESICRGDALDPFFTFLANSYSLTTPST